MEEQAVSNINIDILYAILAVVGFVLGAMAWKRSKP